MREILFRGKRVDNGEWVEGAFYAYYDFKRTIVQILKDRTNGRPDTYEVDPETVGQYTGLTDKNGKKIFEGDIVSHYINWLGKKVYGIVKYEISLASYICFSDTEKISDFLADWIEGNGCEVIGNIHDNPELLKGGADNAE